MEAILVEGHVEFGRLLGIPGGLRDTDAEGGMVGEGVDFARGRWGVGVEEGGEEGGIGDALEAAEEAGGLG
jgi:hypothetical protein